MELFQAHKQWATRPADQRFPTLQALYDATKAYAATAGEKTVPFADIRTEARDNDVRLVGKADIPATLTNWSFGQLCNRVGAPASYMRELPATLAAQNLNYGLSQRKDDGSKVDLLFHKNGGLLLRALTSDKYERIWNWEVAKRLVDLQQYGWEPARPDFNKSVSDFPAIYASDHDMFAFVRLPKMYIQQPINKDDAPLYRGAIYSNSEVGASKIRVTKFWYSGMCGNHIIWGASDVTEVSARHIGKVRDKLHAFDMVIRRLANDSVSDDEAKIKKAVNLKIAETKDGLLDRLFGIRNLGLSRKTLEAGYEAVQPEQDGNPLTVWGMTQGLTRHSQETPYADERLAIDRAAGKLLDIEF